MSIKLIEVLKNSRSIYHEIDEIKTTMGLRVLKPIYFGDYEYFVSVQASEFHYCTPRETIPLEEYTHFEIMLSIPIKDIPVSWEDYHDTDSVYTYVPFDAVERLVNDLDRNYSMVKSN